MKGLKKILRRLSLKRAIRKVVQLMYSDIFPLSTEDGQKCFIEKVSSKNNNRNLLNIYFAIQLVRKNISFSSEYEPIQEKEIEEILVELEKIETYPYKLMLQALNVQKLQANVALRRASEYFRRGKEAYENNQHSFEGMRYIKEKNNKRPLALKEHEEQKKNSQELNNLEIQLDIAKKELQEVIKIDSKRNN